MSAVPIRRRRILVVDDDPIALQGAREMLESAGWEVTTRSEALGTSAYVVRERPDVVLLDIEMPALSGAGLAQILAEQREHLSQPVIFYSAKAPAELEHLAKRSGALGAIQKTDDRRRFLRELDHLLANRPA